MNRIREFRKKIGMTQIELSNVLNISQGSLSGYETGRIEPDNTTLMKMADIFHVSVDEILGYNKSPQKSDVQEKLSEIGSAIRSPAVNQKLKRLTAGLLNMPANDLDFVDRLLSGTYPEYFKEGNEEDDDA